MERGKKDNTGKPEDNQLKDVVLRYDDCPVCKVEKSVIQFEHPTGEVVSVCEGCGYQKVKRISLNSNGEPLATLDIKGIEVPLYVTEEVLNPFGMVYLDYVDDSINGEAYSMKTEEDFEEFKKAISTSAEIKKTILLSQYKDGKIVKTSINL